VTRARDRGKENERALAKIFKTKRKGPTGEFGSDMISELFSIEAKERDQFPNWMTDAMAQARGDSHGKIPIVVFHLLGTRHDNDMVLISLKDLLLTVKGG
jgi:hypothetical protein